MGEADIKKSVTHRVHRMADEVDWSHLTIPERSKLYEFWTADPQVGGLLNEVMDPERVRVYLKDTIMKNYARSRRPEILPLLRSMSMPCDPVLQEYIKPVAVLCDHRYLYTLTVAKEWKISIMSAYERGLDVGNLDRNIVFITEHTTGRFVDRSYRNMIESAAERLEVDVRWVT